METMRHLRALMIIVGCSSLIGCTVARHSADIVVTKGIERAKTGIQRVGVAPFAFDRPEHDQLATTSIIRPKNAGEIVADAVTVIPMKLGYDVIDRRQLKTLLDEHNLTVADLLKPNTSAELGRTLGIQAVIVGTVTELNTWHTPGLWGDIAAFSARMIRLDTGEVLWNITCEKSGQSGHTELLRVLCNEAVEKLRAAGAGK
jgi:hypothetical protein